MTTINPSEVNIVNRTGIQVDWFDTNQVRKRFENNGLIDEIRARMGVNGPKITDVVIVPKDALRDLQDATEELFANGKVNLGDSYFKSGSHELRSRFFGRRD